MLIAHKIALVANKVQATYVARAASAARFAYNCALAQWQRQYEACKADAALPRPSQLALRSQLNGIKSEPFPWMLEVPKNAPQMAIIQLGAAFRNFFAGRAKYPKFRKKGLHDRFSLTNDQLSVDGSRIRIPNLGWVRMRERLRFTGKSMSATVSGVADRWFVSVTVDTPDSLSLPPTPREPCASAPRPSGRRKKAGTGVTTHSALPAMPTAPQATAKPPSLVRTASSGRNWKGGSKPKKCRRRRKN